MRRTCFYLDKFWAKACKIAERILEKNIGIPKTEQKATKTEHK